MIFSGIMLTGLMYKEKDVQINLSKRWRFLHLNKFILSLMLTPFFDKIVYLISGLDVNSNSNEWPAVYRQFKFGLLLGQYGFSVWIRKFREDNNDFID